VAGLHQQAEANELLVEILVFDDGSPQPPEENEAINGLSMARYQKLEKNLGRSGVRNLLAKTARHEFLLFLDADTAIIRDNFLVSYLEAVKPESQIIYGGITYQKEPPAANERLRWVYGHKREALSVASRRKEPHLRFLTLNFMIKKTVFEKLRFNEDIPNLRHEDTLFALDAGKMGIDVAHIDNPVMHLGLESSEVFLRKSREACDALLLLVGDKLIAPEQTALSRVAQKYSQSILGKLAVWIYDRFGSVMERHLLSASPSLKVFDLYRLGYYLKKANI
jgi:glycosyltransferase involved in cell wall biosynthesis